MLDSDYRETLQERTQTFSRIAKLETALSVAELKIKFLMDERERRRTEEQAEFHRESYVLMVLMGIATFVVFGLILR